MIFALFGLVLLVIFLLIAVRVGVNKEKTELAQQNPVIHQSGIYSIVRRSPREQIGNHKPSSDTLAKYLAEQTVDSRGAALNPAQRQDLLARWSTSLEESIKEIEDGDRDAIGFYVYDFDSPDTVCAKTVKEHAFVSREQIFKYPRVIPPFHLGCRCRLKRYKGEENLLDTQTTGLRCLFRGTELPTLPDWKHILA